MAKPLAAYQTRLLNEYHELDERIAKLEEYLYEPSIDDTKVVKPIHVYDTLLLRQLPVMKEYRNILYMRVQQEGLPL